MWFIHNEANKIQRNNKNFIFFILSVICVDNIITMLPISVFLQNHHALEMPSELFHSICTASEAQQTHSDQGTSEAKTQNYSCIQYMPATYMDQ